MNKPVCFCLFSFILPPCLCSFLFVTYLDIFCLAKPITPLCWYLVVLGYLPALHPIFNSYVHAFMYTWMNGISLSGMIKTSRCEQHSCIGSGLSCLDHQTLYVYKFQLASIQFEVTKHSLYTIFFIDHCIGLITACNCNCTKYDLATLAWATSRVL